MKIPVRNLYHLLCYAWDALDEGDVATIGSVDAPGVHDLLASVLAGGINHILRRGLDRYYVELREDTSSPRGRIDLQETAKRLLLRHGKVHVATEDLLADIEANQILKAAARGMMQVSDLDSAIHEELALAYRALRDVSDVRLSPELFRRVRLHRNNRSYHLLMEVCELICDNLLPDESGEGARFRDFVRDERRMRMLFQKFVTSFYQRRQNEFKVVAEAFPWQDAIQEHTDPVSLPWLRTDIVLTSSQHKIVIDTKFTHKPFESYLGGQTLRAGHLYQLYAYLQNIAWRDGGQREVSGILLYPAVGTPFSLTWRIQGMTVRAVSFSLDQDWQQVESDLLGLVRDGNETCHLPATVCPRMRAFSAA